MEHTANLALPFILPSQAQKHVTHNEAIRSLDALVQLAVVDRNLSAPPVSPAEGARYLVPAGGTGAWSGKDGMIAAWQDGAWAFFAPKSGWLTWVADEQRLICYDGANWRDAAVHSVNPVALVGVSVAADATNRLAVKSPASLFDQETGDHRLKINKAAPGNTASLIFQSGYSGRAEFGLAGDDDWHVKVSADGSAWTEALQVNRTTGRVRLPAALQLSDDDQVVARRHIREKLTANRIYYVRTDGSDSNTGLANTSGGAFLTKQKAYDVICANLDLAGYTVTVEVEAGTYTGGLAVNKSWTGGGSVVFDGDTTTPANVLVDRTASNGVHITAPLPGPLVVRGFKFQCATSGSAIFMSAPGALTLGNNNYGTCTGGFHIRADVAGASITLSSAYSITGGALRHYDVSAGAFIAGPSGAVTSSGTFSFGSAFFYATLGGFAQMGFTTFSGGTIAGQRYLVSMNGAVSVGGGGANVFPGSTAGTTSTGGQYA